MDRRSLFPLLVVCFVLVAFQSSAWAQVQMILPSTSVVEESGDKKIRLDIRFAHPFKGNVVAMEKPNKFGVMRQGKKLDLMYLVKPIPVKGLQAFEVYYPINDPGDYVFYLQPNTWFDSTQKTLHVQPTKVVVNAYGEESGWDAELQEPAEILPLAQPYALWTGNSFRGVVKYRQKAVPFTKVHVVYFNENQTLTAPTLPLVDQVIKTDASGVFSYTLPKSGWWGFKADIRTGKRWNHQGRPYPLYYNPVIWVQVTDLPTPKTETEPQPETATPSEETLLEIE